MDKQTFLIALIGGQFALLALDIRERFQRQHSRTDGDRLRPATLVFLAVTIGVYGTLQYGGLALVPSAEELLVYSQAFVSRWLMTSSVDAGIDAHVGVAVGIASFYFAGLCDYLFHRFVSHSRPLWFSHENHHLTTDVALYMPGLAVRPFAVVSILPTTAVTIFSVQLIIGVGGHNAWNMLPLLYSVVLVQASVLGLSHSAFLRRCGWVHQVLHPLGITTPQEHWLHHTSDLECNYGNFVTLWDRIFGTYIDPQTVEDREHRAGLDYDQDYLGTLTLGKLKLSERLRRRFELDRFCYLESVASSAWPDELQNSAELS